MAVIVDTNRSSQADQTAQIDLTHNKLQDASVALPPKWVEDNLSYLAHVQALLAGLTEADQDTLHASLQEE